MKIVVLVLVVDVCMLFMYVCTFLCMKSKKQ